jgi:hypothetical protein
MPQVYVILGPATRAQLPEPTIHELGCYLLGVVEVEFGIVGENDTVFTAVRAATTIDEADVQIEIRYTAGGDEYKRGQPFNPSLDTQERCANKLEAAFKRFLKDKDLPDYSLSIWFKPYLNSHFRMCEKPADTSKADEGRAYGEALRDAGPTCGSVESSRIVDRTPPSDIDPMR